MKIERVGIEDVIGLRAMADIMMLFGSMDARNLRNMDMRTRGDADSSVPTGILDSDFW